MLMSKFAAAIIFSLSSQFVFVSIAPPSANAQEDVTEVKNPDGSVTKKDANGNVISTSYPSASSGVGSQGANSSSNSNGAQGLLSTGINVAVGGLMMKQFAQTCATSPPACNYAYLGMGLMSFAQAGASSGAAGGSFQAADMTSFCPECFNSGITDYGLGADGSKSGIFGLDPSMKINGGPYNTVGELQTAMKSLAAQAKDTGYKIDMENQKLVAPDGTETSFAAVNDMASNGTGLSEGEYADLKATLAEAEKMAANYKVAAVGFDGGGGGGASSFKFDPIAQDSSFSDYLKKLRGQRQPAAVAGMKKIINGGEAIGVAGDDIFQMIHRSYQRKRKENTFLD